MDLIRINSSDIDKDVSSINLFIDDCKTDWELIKETFPDKSRNMIFTNDEYEFMRLVVRNNLKNIFIDINMPTIDGFTILEALKDYGRTHPKLWILTDHPVEYVEEKIKQKKFWLPEIAGVINKSDLQKIGDII